MASFLYDKGREKYLGGDLDWDADDVRVMLVKSSYTPSAAHEFLADLGSVDNGRSGALGTKTKTSGVADAADSSLAATGAVACAYLVLFKHTGSDATAAVIAKIDIDAFTPSAGQTINLVFDSGANKIFKL